MSVHMSAHMSIHISIHVCMHKSAQLSMRCVDVRIDTCDYDMDLQTFVYI